MAQSTTKAVVSTAQVRAELMAHAPDGVQSGSNVWVGLQLTHQPRWHTYWKNSGDSGLPTVLQWTLPAGVQAAEIAWPLPKKIPIGTLANYGYEDTVLLPVKLTITPDFKPALLSGDLQVGLKANWLVCQRECIPEEGEFALKIAAKGSTALNANAFEAAFKAQPQAIPNGAGAEVSSASVQGPLLKLSVFNLPAQLQGRTLEFFPETPEVIETGAVLQTGPSGAAGARSWTQGWNGAVWNASIPLSPQRSNSPALMPVLLALGEGTQRQGYRTELKVLGSWPAVATGSALMPSGADAQSDTTARPGSPIGLLAAVFGALLGGLILNLMPCVFPVLSIKLIEFARHAQDRRSQRISGAFYTLGVLLSFLALGGLMLSLRAAGEQLGWGFQLQSPAVVASLALLFTLLGLNLAGVFEFGRFLPSRLVAHQAQHPSVNALVSGELAVAVASPCTAPFMGASLGLALGLPATEALLIFAAIGFGMALPFLLASQIPALAQALPRPGAWMETMRRLMAFPMFATVVWLVWILGQQTGIDGAGALLALLLAVSMLIWALATLSGRSRVLLGGLSLLTLALLLGSIGANVTRPAQAGPMAAPGERWQTWEPGRVEQLLAAGQPVFVDFTAAWCVTCQYNKKTTLANASVLADLERKRVVQLRADWTRHDPAITAALRQLGRSGVPLYVLYQRGSAPVLLSEILSVDEVRTALARL